MPEQGEFPCAADRPPSAGTYCRCCWAALIADVRVTHPLAASAVKAVAQDTGAAAKAVDMQKRDNHGYPASRARVGVETCLGRRDTVVKYLDSNSVPSCGDAP